VHLYERKVAILDGNPHATLSDKRGRGGVRGGKGYDFQAAYIVSRIPLWLADPDFVQFLQEGAGDVDVRFNRAGGEERWYVQVKSYEVKPAKAREVLAQFRDTDTGSPGTYTRFILACPGLHADLKRLRAAVEELRGVAPFYRPGQDEILDNTWADLENVVESIELPVDAAFLVHKVYFDTDLAGLTSDESLRDLFVGRLLRLEAWARVKPAEAVRAYKELELLSHRAIRETCSREQVEAILRKAAGRTVERYNTEAIRQLLTAAFSHDSLSIGTIHFGHELERLAEKQGNYEAVANCLETRGYALSRETFESFVGGKFFPSWSMLIELIECLGLPWIEQESLTATYWYDRVAPVVAWYARRERDEAQ